MQPDTRTVEKKERKKEKKERKKKDKQGQRIIKRRFIRNHKSMSPFTLTLLFVLMNIFSTLLSD